MKKEQFIRLGTKKLPHWASYDGNSLILKPNVKIHYTEQQLEEILKCSKDILYFAKNYVYIIDPNKGKTLIDFTTREYQINLLKHLQDNRHSCLLLSRQTGKSSCCAILTIWYSLFHPDKQSAILANKEKIAKEIFKKIKLAYERLPFWLQVGIKQWNETSMELCNGSTIFCASTSSSSIRGITVNGILVLDEFAHISKGIVDDFFTSVYPTISASDGSKIIIVSTPNGLNHFHTVWTKSKKNKNNFAPFTIKWNDPPGRNEEWLKRTISDIGEIKAKQEFLMEFLGSSKTLINSNRLQLLEADFPKEVQANGKLLVYQEPEPDKAYIIGVDSSKGVGGDYSVCQVIDITEENNFKQVAVFRDNTIGIKQFSEVIINLAKKYNQAYLAIENNGEGSLLIHHIWNEVGYENLVDYDTNKTEYGIRATVKSKNKALDILKDYVENNKIVLVDENTIYELSRFIEIRAGVYRGEDGENDDCISALYWALFSIVLSDFKEIRESIVEDIKVEKEKPKEDDLVEPLTPFFGNNNNMEDEFAKELLKSYAK